MSLNFFDHRETITKNLVTFLRQKGYSKLSLSKLSDITRPTIDQIIKGEGLNSEQYNKQIEKINKTFDLPVNYFITPLISITPTMYTYSDHVAVSERSSEAEKLLDGLNSILEIYSLYLK
jgi:transcriptional regulator with XRE-family HTH domain